MLISIEKHEGHRIIQLVHSIEVRNLSYVNYIESYKFAQLKCHFQYDLIYLHTCTFPIMAKTNNHQLVCLGQYCLIDFPSIIEMRQNIRHSLILQFIIDSYYFVCTHKFKFVIKISKFYKMKAIEVRLVGRFRFQKKIPGEHEHLLYMGVHTQNDSYVFMKGDQTKKKPSMHKMSILQEGKILQSMQGGIGIPHMHWCGQEQDYNFIVIEQLSKDLSKLLKKCDGKFTLKTSLLLGIQIISILQYFHFKNYIHCGLKPQHFMIGSGSKYTKLFIIDYASSIRFRDNQTLQHLTQQQKKSDQRYFNMQFSSPAYQKGETPSRKDDIISLLYLLAYFQKGELPWSKFMKQKIPQKQRFQLIYQMKTTLSSRQIFQGCIDLATLYEATIRLKFDEKPRYSYYKNVFRQRLQRQGEIEDSIYDWILIPDEQEDLIQQLCLDLQIIPNQAQFLSKLQEQIRARDKSQAQKVSLAKAKQAKKTSAPLTKEKQCRIF